MTVPETPAPVVNAPTPPATNPVVATSIPTPSPFEGVEITFRAERLNPARQEVFRKEIARFKELTGITVKHDFSGRTWDHRRPHRTLADTMTDILHGFSSSIPRFAWKGLLLDLTDYVASWSDWRDFYPHVREDVVYDGGVVGIPFRTNYRGSVVIRPSMFKSAGLEPVPPSTWDELNEVAPKLTVRDGNLFEQAGFNQQHHAQVYEDWLVQAGGATFNFELTEPLHNTPQGQMALSQHVRHGLIDQTMPREGTKSGVPNLNAFCAGQIAIQPLWPGNVGNCQTNAPDVFDDLLVGPPLAGPSQRSMQLHVDKYMAWRLTNHPDAVFETMKYFASADISYDLNIVADRSMPCRKAMEGFELFETEPWRSFSSFVQYTQPRQIVPEHFDVEPAMTRWVLKAAMGESSVEEALIGMDDEVRKIIWGL